MRNFLLVFALVFIVVFSFLMLRNKANAPDSPNEQTQNQITDEDTSSSPISIEEETELYTISLSVPGGLPQGVHTQVMSDLNRAIAQIKDASDYASEITGMLWLSTEEVKEFSGSGTKSLVVPISEYAGGAHGNMIYYTYTYTPDGTLLTLGDALENNEEKLAHVRTVATERLLDKFYTDIERNDFGNPPEGIETEKSFMREMVEMGVADVGADYSTWAIDEGELLLIFPPYAVAPYAYGTQEVRIPLSEI